MSTQVIHIAFPELKLHPSAGHKLRGYLGSLFREHSPLLHNHFEDGTLRYRYPLVQYKILDKVPMILGLGEGASLLAQLFMKINQLDLDGESYEIHNKSIVSTMYLPAIGSDLYGYRFHTLWMALNQDNHARFEKENADEQKIRLKKILIGNILSFLKGVDIRLNEQERVLAELQVQQSAANFKDRRMVAFSGTFTANIRLPDHIGLGKAVSRGFGAIRQIT